MTVQERYEAARKMYPNGRRYTRTVYAQSSWEECEEKLQELTEERAEV